MIMPLASEVDKRTQVLWGVADFRHRFGRDPEGMWLAETAVDLASLEALADAGIKFTILAPRQAASGGEGSARRPGTRTAAASIRRRPILPAPLGPFDRAVLLRRDHLAAGRLRAAAGSRRAVPGPSVQRVRRDTATIAQLDAHRHRRRIVRPSPRARRHGLGVRARTALQETRSVKLTNYGEFLELHPPKWEVEIHENSSWSCVHGVERWRSDCGCKTRGDWHQKWRGPLRAAFDGLKEQLDHLFGTRGRVCFRDPWAARDGYIDVILNRYSEDVDQGVLEGVTAIPIWTSGRRPTRSGCWRSSSTPC